MATLTNEHIQYIIQDLAYRGIVLEEFRDEVIDHICSCTEAELAGGLRFIDAYHSALKKFGHTRGLRQTQEQILISETRTPRNMLRNYFTIAFRNLKKHRFYTLINVAGLAIGIAACLVITLYIFHELSYDKHFAHADRIYRVNAEILFNGNHHRLAVMPAPAAKAFLTDFPEVEASGHFRQWGWRRLKHGDETIKERFTVYGSNGILDVFSLPLISGNAKNALAEPNTLVMSRTKAELYFPGQSAVGQTIVVDDELYKVTGVYEDFPSNTHMKFDFIMSMEGLEESKDQNWLSNNFNTYIRLKEGATAAHLQAKIPKLIETHVVPQIQVAFGGDVDMIALGEKGNKFEYSLTPLTDIHLHSDRTAELSANGDITYVYLFGAIAVFILGIACINFMNLSTARSANRAKEVGVRKVLGSLRSHLVRQFLVESVLLSLFSFAIALVLAQLAIPVFNTLAESSLSIPIGSVSFLMVLFAAALFVGFLAGLYPSFFLSAFKPVNVLKGKASLGMKSGFIRSALVVVQFMISIFLVIGTIVAQRQLAYIQNKKLGFAKDQVVVLHNTDQLGNRKEAFRNTLLGYPSISAVSTSGYLPIAGWGRNDTTFWPEGTQPTPENMISMQYWFVDYDYVPTLGMNIVEGRNFSRDFPSDSTALIVNQAAAKRFGFDDPIGRKIESFEVFDATIDFKKTKTFTIVGVVEDFHFESLKQNITPLCLQLGPSGWSMPVRFASADTREVMNQIEKEWKAIMQDVPFEYTFLDEAFGDMYTFESRLGQVFAIFAGLAIIIACLGLFALSAFTAEQRTKEIGIRKVLGASVSSIVVLLSKEFGKLIVIAFILAAPLSWFAVDLWLRDYTYKVEIGIFVYLFAGLAAFIAAWLTMSYQSIKAARSNPVQSLRSE